MQLSLSLREKLESPYGVNGEPLIFKKKRQVSKRKRKDHLCQMNARWGFHIAVLKENHTKQHRMSGVTFQRQYYIKARSLEHHAAILYVLIKSYCRWAMYPWEKGSTQKGQLLTGFIKLANQNSSV